MPRKTFQNGYPLPASDLNTYLMDQSVQTFASAAARTSALATPTEGMISTLDDTDLVYRYDGTSWVAIGTIADGSITAAKLAADSVTTAKILDANVTNAKLANSSITINGSAVSLGGSVVTTGDVAGKNKIINGGFDFWQRGTTFTNIGQQYTADRWFFYPYGAGQPFTISRQTSGAPTGFSAYLRAVQSGATSSNIFMAYTLETADVIKLAGQAATLSFWYKIPVNFSQAVFANINYNTSVDSPPTTLIPSGTGLLNTALTNTTSWTRVSFTVNVPSSATSMTIYLASTSSTVSGATLDFTGVQLEAGSVATPFSRAGGTLQGELAACQRYYTRWVSTDAYAVLGVGFNFNTGRASIALPLPTTMRTKPSSVEYSALGIAEPSGSVIAATAVGIQYATNQEVMVAVDVAGGLTQYRPSQLFTNNNAAGYLGLSAEL